MLHKRCPPFFHLVHNDAVNTSVWVSCALTPPITTTTTTNHLLHASKGVVDIPTYIRTRSADTKRSSPNGLLVVAAIIITPLIHTHPLTQNLQPNVDTHTHICMMPAAANRRRGLQSSCSSIAKRRMRVNDPNLLLHK